MEEKPRFAVCPRVLVSRRGADIGTLSAVLGRSMIHPNPGMLAVLPSLSADAVQSVRDYNIRATNVKVRSSGAISRAEIQVRLARWWRALPRISARETRLNMAVLVKF